MQFARYFRAEFSIDLELILRASRQSQHDHANELAIQPRMLSSENVVIGNWSPERRALFGAALFLTILTDQVCYSYFQPAYSQFHSLTRYPKLRGDCPSACSYHLHPATVFPAIGRTARATPETDAFPYDALPADTLTSMREVVAEFVRDHMAELGESFWARCDAEIPQQLRSALDPM
jgi:hypothetical protein